MIEIVLGLCDEVYILMSVFLLELGKKYKTASKLYLPMIKLDTTYCDNFFEKKRN